MAAAIDRPLWRNRTVLITGHTGFKGAWLSLWLQELGAKVVGYALSPPTTPSLFERADVPRQMISVEGDVRDLRALSDAVRTHRPDIVFHLAAQALVRRSRSAPVETFETNVLGTVNLLEAVRLAGCVRAVVVVTSDKCYDNKEWLWGYRETDVLGGTDPYSSSKACAELVTASYRCTFFSNNDGARVGSARAGNVIGGGDWAQDRLVPDIMRAFTAGKPLILRNPNAIRPWQHVLDPLCGYLLLAERLYAGESDFAGAWNFGPSQGEVTSVGLLARQFVQAWGAPGEIVACRSDVVRESQCLALDSAKARSRLDWRPRWSLATAVSNTISWYRACEAGKDMRLFSLDQISQYVEGGAASPAGIHAARPLQEQ